MDFVSTLSLRVTWADICCQVARMQREVFGPKRKQSVNVNYSVAKQNHNI